MFWFRQSIFNIIIQSLPLAFAICEIHAIKNQNPKNQTNFISISGFKVQIFNLKMQNVRLFPFLQCIKM